MPSTVASEPPPARLHRGRLRPSAGRRFARLLLRLTIIFLLSGLLGGSWYLAKKGFSRNWRDLVVQELHKRGVEASVRRLTLDPFRGLIARDVRIYDYKKRERTLALVSEISLDINYAALFHREPFLNAVDIRNGEMTIPLPPVEGQSANAELKKFRAHVYFPPERIEVSQAEGLFYGVRISASGQLIKRADYRPSPPSRPEDVARRVRLLQTVVTMLEGFRYEGNAPELQVKFSGDLSSLEDARAEATLRAGHVARGAYAARDLFVTAEWKDQTLNVPQCEWSDAAGRFSGTASWRRADGRANFQARSTVDLKSLLGSFSLGAVLGDLTFSAPPLVEGSGSAIIGSGEKSIQVVGRTAADKFTYRKVPFDGLTCDFAWDGARTMLRDIRLRARVGQLTGDLLDAPNDFRLNLESSLLPTTLAPLAPPRLQPFLAEWEWQRAPNVRISIRGASRDPASWVGDGTLALGRTRFRGAWMNSASAGIKFGHGDWALQKIRVVRDEGTGSGSLGYTASRREFAITDVQTTLNPNEAILWIDPKFWKFVAPYRFHRTPRISADGVVQLGGGKGTHLALDVDAPAGMDYTFLDKVLPFDRVAAHLLFTHDRLQISDLNSSLLAGSLTGSADISLGEDDSPYTAQLIARDIDFPGLTDLYFKYKTSQGALSGKFDFGGRGGDVHSLHGTGRLAVTNGNVFAIPIFGPLSELLNKMFAGAGYSVAHEATAPFTVQSGVIHTDKLKVAGKLFAMLGHGDLKFIENKLDFDVRIDATGAGAVLTPLYKLFEYHGEGSLSKPVWRPKRF